MEAVPRYPRTAHPQFGELLQDVVLDEIGEEGIPPGTGQDSGQGPGVLLGVAAMRGRAARRGGRAVAQVLFEGLRELLAVGGDEGQPLGQVLAAELGRVGDVGQTRRVVAFEEGVQAACGDVEAFGGAGGDQDDLRCGVGGALVG
ncbi:hypothetical protein SVIOM74S_08865 [Streptomyces violarus]